MTNRPTTDPSILPEREPINLGVIDGKPFIIDAINYPTMRDMISLIRNLLERNMSDVTRRNLEMALQAAKEE